MKFNGVITPKAWSDSFKVSFKRTFLSWSFQHYRRFAIGALVMNLGTWMNRIAQDWLIIQLTGSGLSLGIITGLQFAPAIFFSFYGGGLGDRHDKKKIMSICSFFIAISGLVLAFFVYKDMHNVLIVYTFALVVGIFASIDMPIRHSLMSDLVGEPNVPNAVSLNSVNFNIARIIGPTLAGITVHAFGVPTALLLSTCCYSVFAIMIFGARNTEHISRNIEVDSTSLFAILKFIWTDKAIVKVLVIIATVAFFGLNFPITTALMAVNVFKLDAAGYGLLSSTIAIGALFGGLISANRNKKVPITRLASTSLIFGVWQIGAGFSPNIFFYSSMLALSGLFALLTTIAINSLIQDHSPYAIRGKILGIYTVIFSGGMAFGGPAIGFFADLIGPQNSLKLGGTSVIIISFLVIYSSLEFRLFSSKQRK
jgi:MFS family permease